MKRFWLLSLMIAAVGVASAASEPTYRSGEVLVKFRPGVDLAFRAERLGRMPSRRDYGLGATLKRTMYGTSTVVLQLPPSVSVERAVRYYQSRPDVELAQPNFIYRPAYVPNDPLVPQQWALDLIKAPQGWDITKGTNRVVIAILDSGINPEHPDLVDKIVPGYDTYQGDSDPTDEDTFFSHGTFCAGLAAASTDNGIGIAGVGFNARIMPVRVLGPFGGSSDSVASGIRWAADNGADVLNLSLGSSRGEAVMADAIAYAHGMNKVVIAAAGNSSTNRPFYPAYYSSVIAVGATDKFDAPAWFTNYGPWVDVAAPGDTVMGTIFNGYAEDSGTSFSSPMVAGLAALLRSLAGISVANTEIRDAIESTTDPVGTWVAKGRVNCEAALYRFIGQRAEFDAGMAAVIRGTGAGSNAPANLNLKDDVFYTVSSAKRDREGAQASFYAEYTLPAVPSRVIQVGLMVDSTGPSRVTQFIFLWNWRTGQYDTVKAMRMSPDAGATHEVSIRTGSADYVSPTGVVRAAIRAIEPRGVLRSFDINVDRLRAVVQGIP